MTSKLESTHIVQICASIWLESIESSMKPKCLAVGCPIWLLD